MFDAISETTALITGTILFSSCILVDGFSRRWFWSAIEIRFKSVATLNALNSLYQHVVICNETTRALQKQMFTPYKIWS